MIHLQSQAKRYRLLKKKAIRRRLLGIVKSVAGIQTGLNVLSEVSYVKSTTTFLRSKQTLFSKQTPFPQP